MSERHCDERSSYSQERQLTESDADSGWKRPEQKEAGKHDLSLNACPSFPSNLFRSLDSLSAATHTQRAEIGPSLKQMQAKSLDFGFHIKAVGVLFGVVACVKEDYVVVVVVVVVGIWTRKLLRTMEANSPNRISRL